MGRNRHGVGGVMRRRAVEDRGGIGNAELGERLPLDRFHRFRLGFILVIVAEQMQHAVGDQVGDMVLDRDAQLACLPDDRFTREDHIPDRPLAHPVPSVRSEAYRRERTDVR